MQATPCIMPNEMSGWMNHKPESRLPREISITCYADDTTLSAESKEELNDESDEESEQAGLKLNIQKKKIMASSPITSWQIDEETVETVLRLYFGGLQNHCRW